MALIAGYPKFVFNLFAFGSSSNLQSLPSIICLPREMPLRLSLWGNLLISVS